MKEIVEDILKRLQNDLLSIPEFSVGLESRVEQVMEFINGQSGKACVVGIWGMGGSGKTTLAKAYTMKFAWDSCVEASLKQVIEGILICKKIFFQMS